ncbi:ATP-binding cassette domain-containing protein (plasmid) [Phaeobacter inhibens]|uniref:ABC transporter ATP-binding protein n=1 Tax=Phaeobacter inhibens TaxID=221822 RepID=UPI0001632AA9|nr:ATP-binding cassette domain-containing protein [Phaeobacter inhibens]AFO93441.1 putative ABC transporter, ATP binding protein [Phaeobacter inhibens DSM 17395]AUQ48143.1 putative ABC transporter, ATP binding protein [Phaeobacter inhibens]AXT24934.1 ATP-binding cassette domain-containing protein [Phaeobacter inhibens]UWR55021.1 ATP-binding cassette domain-containing protein [Phaeobacter inhibens]UWR58844.1 ATP-binding cassette domain-containing protein [Phaeobacter inhibens]
MLNATLEINDLAYRWPGRDGFSLTVPHLTVAAGETVLLLGESGSGKSTLLSLICGTVLPDRGEISIAGKTISALNNGARDTFRADHIGVIFQQFNLLPFGSVIDNILLPLRFAPSRRQRVSDAIAEASRLCSALNLPEGVISAKARTLSVGQQQRVAVARALIGTPPLIIADEPTSALDSGVQSAFLDLLFTQTASHGSSLLMVSHDSRLSACFDRVIHIEDIAQVKRAMT